jgi:phosphoglycolate phosphatase
LRYPLVVFDWDGTIIDSAATIVECIQQAALDMGLDAPERERASHVIGLGLHDALRIAVPALAPARYPEFVELYRKHFLAREASMQLFGGMRELLCELAGARTLAIATGKSRRGLERALQASGLHALFSASRCADETRPKPDPAMLLEIMQELQVEAGSTLMIGDTSHDLEMAQAAGVAAVAVTYGAHAPQALAACAPLGCVASVPELQAWLNRNA